MYIVRLFNSGFYTTFAGLSFRNTSKFGQNKGIKGLVRVHSQIPFKRINGQIRIIARKWLYVYFFGFESQILIYIDSNHSQP